MLGLIGPLLRPLLALSWVRPLRGLAHPLAALPLWITDLCLWHLPALCQAALRDDSVHALGHFAFFTFGALMWATVIEPLLGPVWFGNGWKATYTLVVRAAGAILAKRVHLGQHPVLLLPRAPRAWLVAAAFSGQRGRARSCSSRAA